ncbi:MAG TPA: methylmalonyl Co-A mutase-associated GTPase MeaB [Gemmatimonadaceae bacterium]|nr:methylmalonyl Co-A mutase-associated GTPase MeaB [Gemmatimonadaceae bacterium]
MTESSLSRSRHEQLLTDFDAGAPAALARAVSVVENHRPGFEEVLGRLHPRLGRARRVGLTGPPGAGKSTLGMRLARAWRSSGLTVGIVAVDPTSPFTGGALLGDRIRMEEIALDPGIFIRSMGTRGSLGGLAASTREVADVLDAFGFDRVLIETVGVGQSELDIARIADSTAVVLVPESGDAIQTMKAGLMEIADVFVVNKSDRPGADRLRHEIEITLGLRMGQTYRDVPGHHGVQHRVRGKEDKPIRNPAYAARNAAAANDADHWTPPVISTMAERGEGVDDLVTAFDRHFDYLERSGILRSRRRQRLRERVVEVVERRVRERLWRDQETNAWLDEALPALDEGSLTPFAAAEALLERSAELITRGQRS